MPHNGSAEAPARIHHSLCRDNAPYRIEVGGVLTASGLVRHKHVLTVLGNRRWLLRRGAAEPGGPPVLRRFPHAAAAPALADAHVHLHAGMRLADFVAYGVCQVRDLGSTAGTELAVPVARHCGDPVPEVVLGGPLLDRPGKPRLNIAARWNRHDELPAVLDAAIGRGASWIKLYAQFPVDLIGTVVRQAHARDLRVAVHPAPGDAPAAIRAGVDEIEHAACLAPRGDGVGGAHALHRRWAQRSDDSWPDVPAGVRLCPTLVVQHRLAEEASRSWSFPGADPGTAAFWRGMRLASRQWTDQELRNCRAASAEMASVVARLVRQGVHLVVGSDTPNPGVLPGRGLWEEMNLLVAAGLPPLEVYLAAAVTGSGLDAAGDEPVTLLPLASLASFEAEGRYPVEPAVATVLRGCLFVPDRLSNRHGDRDGNTLPAQPGTDAGVG
ncbi:hypothetical protein [Saccharopolyspora taberi]|uniref:Amidohydrolase-related domain-containing protein n=1 Tax=Saccharopolyspora taberi TaxID=60895 RepID=A0ABN3VIB2_9PSEU